MTSADVLVIGAGPAGIAAATAAAEHGRNVVLLDDNPTPGGQIWRDGIAAAGAGKDVARQRALERLVRSGATVLHGYRVFNAPAPRTVHAIREGASGYTTIQLRYEQLILATGSRELFLPFSGWTQPGVFGAGGLQALVKGGFSIAGKRVVVAGTGPLLLAVAAHLRDYGATVACIAEQAPIGKLASFAASLWSHPAKIVQGLRYRASLAKTPFRTGCWPIEALGSGTRLRAVRLTDGRRMWEETCDLLACGFHLVPNTELASMLGCTLQEGFVQVDRDQRTSVAGVFCVGEPTGIAGLESALLQGEIAGLACAGQSTVPLQSRAAKERAFAGRLAKTFALRAELQSVPKPETIVCRCEDVMLSQLRGHIGWTEAKLQSRCGMGPCQGRICGPALEFLLGWKPVSVRPPLFPVPLIALYFDPQPIEENA